MDKTYWMIEKNIDGVAHWWMSRTTYNGSWDSPLRWTTNPHKARHYESKGGADYVIGKEMIGCFATEHIDMD